MIGSWRWLIRACVRFWGKNSSSPAFAARVASASTAAAAGSTCKGREPGARPARGLRLSLVTNARHNGAMQLTSRLALMNWLTGQGLTGLPENELLRGFCERCRAEGLELSRGLVVIDTLHPIYEGRGFRWSDRPSNESDAFEYGSTAEGD